MAGEPDFIFRTLRAGFKVVNASEVEVTHLHARASGEDSKKLLTNYAYGTAAAFLKHARLGDVRAATIYARHLIGCAKLVLINAATLHRPMGIGYTLAFLRGSLESFKYRIDRQRRIYVRG